MMKDVLPETGFYQKCGMNFLTIRKISVEPEESSKKLKEFGLDNIQLTFKEQYVSRADMYRYRNRLLNRCAYKGKVLRHFNIHSKISDLWWKGKEVQHGIVTEDTRVVFRSSSSQAFIYIQVSLEMVQMDPQGDIYFEKCVKGSYFP